MSDRVPGATFPFRPTIPDRFDSWKEIAAYLKRDVRTVQRWEQLEGLPVHRHHHGKLGSVYAYRAEIDEWWKRRRQQIEPREIEEKKPETGATLSTAQGPRRRIFLFLAVALFFGVALTLAGLRLWRGKGNGRLGSDATHTLVVLPFENLSGDGTEDYFADGLTDELITDLGKAGKYSVISRTTAMHFKSTHLTLRQIAKELNADAVVEGSVTRHGNRVRITAQLIDATNDRHLWANSYERSPEDLLSLQDDVAGDIVNAVQETLIGKAIPLVASPRKVNPEARLAYLQGRFFWNKRDEVNLKKALSYFDQAIVKDPSYAPAYAGLADCYNLLSVWGSLSPKESFPKAKDAALKALQLNPSLAEAHNSLAFVTYRFYWDWTTAEREFQEAIRLDPNYATAHQWYGEFLADLRRFDQGIAELRKADELDPLSPIVGSDLSAALVYARRYDEAIAALQKIIKANPNFAPAQFYLASIYQLKGDYKSALQEAELYARRSGDSMALKTLEFRSDLAAGKKEEAQKLFEFLVHDAQEGREGFVKIAELEIAMGHDDAALRWLNKAYEEHSWWLVTLLVNSGFDPLRSDARFRDLVHRVGLPQ